MMLFAKPSLCMRDFYNTAKLRFQLACFYQSAPARAAADDTSRTSRRCARPPPPVTSMLIYI